MKPILFSENETSFNSNGIGRLSDAISCVVSETINGIYELTMQYPIEGKYFDQIAEHRIIYCIHDDTTIPQPFEIYRIERPINGIVTVLASHISYRLNKSIVLPFKAEDVQEALVKLKANTATEIPFTFSSDKTTQAKMSVDYPTAIRSLMGGMEGSFIDTYKGEWEFDGFQCILKNRRGSDTDVSIRYGKNLTDVKKNSDNTNLWTGVIPYWHGSVSGGEDEEVIVYDGVVRSSVYQDFPYDMVIPLDVSDEYDLPPTQAQLLSSGQRYVEANADLMIPVSIDVSFVQLWQTEEYKNVAPLQRLRIGDSVNVFYEALGVNNSARIVSYKYNVLTERYDSMTIGSVRASLAQTVSSDIKEATKDVPTKTFLEQAIATATELISGGLGGYIVLNRNADGEPNELLLMNTPNKETATRVIRMNYEGIAFGTGYNGPFNSAWVSLDGTFDASNINVTNLSAASIVTGILRDQQNSNFWNLTTGEFQLSSNTTVGGQTIDEIADAAQAAAEATAAAQLADAVSDLQDQIDGNITTWYYNYVPTLSNAPANTWTTTEDKNNHIGDLFYDSSTGYAYRFMLDGSTYKWIRISDEDISAALQAAQDAQDTADNKRRVFVATPTPPYDIGDLWVQGSSGDIKRCKTAKTSAQTYAAADWILASKYTDDTAVTTLDSSLNQQGVFNRLTNNGAAQGIYLSGGNLYVSASYIRTGTLSADVIAANSITSAKIAEIGGWSINDYQISYYDAESTSRQYGVFVRSKEANGTVTADTYHFVVYHRDYDTEEGAYGSWVIDYGVKHNGSFIATNANITGSITANSGTIGGFTISSTSNTGTTANGGHCYTNSLYTHSSDTDYEYESGLFGGGAYNNAAFYVRRIVEGAQWSTANYTFYVRNDGYMRAENAYIIGTINASGGNVGGWSISKNWQISYTHTETSGSTTTQYQVGIRATGGYNAETDVTTAPTKDTAAIFVQSRKNTGSGYGSWSTAFRVNHDGALTASNVTITGGSISSSDGSSSWNLSTGKLFSSTVIASSSVHYAELYFAQLEFGIDDEKVSTIGLIGWTQQSNKYGLQLTVEDDNYAGFFSHRGSSNYPTLIINNNMDPSGYEEDVIVYGAERITGALTVGGALDVGGAMTVGGTMAMTGKTLILGYDTADEATISCHTGTSGRVRIANGLTVGSGAAVSGYEMRVTGSLYVNSTMSAQTVTQRSDENLKDIIPWDCRLDELIDYIEPIYFRWKDSEDKLLHVGVGARKTESILKELGLTETDLVMIDGGGYAVNYIELSMILLHKYKQLAKKVEELERKQV